MTIVSRIAHHPIPRLLGDGPWWESLDPEFSRWRPPFELDAVDRARVGVTAGSDVVLRTIGASLVAALALPVGYHPLALRRAMRERAFWGSLVDAGDPARLFRRPARGVRVQRRRARMPLFRPHDGVCEDVRFESPYEPACEDVRDAYLSHRANRFAHARHWRHDGKPRPTVIAIHGFSADLYHLNEWFFAVPWLYREGYDVLLFTLPFHGLRQTRFSPFSGHGFFAAGPSGINEAFAQAIHDLRVFMDLLLDSGVPQIGATGVSLGGHTTSLLASVEERLAFAIPNVPVISLADLVLEWEPIGATLRTGMRLGKLDLRDVRKMLAPSCPLTYEPKLPRERLMIIGGVGDRLAPPRQSLLLWEHWGKPKLHWFPGSHLVHLDRGAYFRQMREFLGEIGFGAPRRGRAPGAASVRRVA